ncbi:hypothetical protein PAHAL_6G099700 [Panicum hallii]|uniref:Uncharacterized protein n=1 Tax=Panicum hallii TaxID=206008 RepID=A0A2T8IFV0_9POAL|nr:hypothetical protein PAHAL_6G099700 [Panicum hallii]
MTIIRGVLVSWVMFCWLLCSVICVTSLLMDLLNIITSIQDAWAIVRELLPSVNNSLLAC